MVNGDKIRILRAYAKITQEDLGKAVGVESSMIGYIERNLKDPSVKVLIRIAEYFGVTVDELLIKSSQVDINE